MQSARESWFLLLSIPFYVVLIGAEILFSNWQHKKIYSVQDTIQNVYFTLLNAGLDGLMRWLFYISVLAWSYQYHFYSFENVWLCMLPITLPKNLTCPQVFVHLFFNPFIVLFI